MHKLLKKSHIKFQQAVNNPDKYFYLYLLTSVGLKAKPNPTYRFLQYTLNFYNQIEAKLQQSLREITASGVKKTILCGPSEVVKIVLV